MNHLILTDAVQEYLIENENQDPKELVLKKQKFQSLSNAELAQQLESRQKAKKKLPLWYQTKGIYFPPPLCIEQASSEPAAKYKAQLFPPGLVLLDLTGGFGVDAYYLSLQARQLIHCEHNLSLSEISKHNAGVLKAENITFIAGDGIEYLTSAQEDEIDAIYLDPARRQNAQKVFRLSDCQPNVVPLQELIFQKAQRVLLKAAPILDISSAVNDLLYVKEVHIISLKNECKELLFYQEKGHSEVPQFIAKGLTPGQSFEFSFTVEEEKNAIPTHGFPREGDYVYDPDAALLKAGCFKLLAERFELEKLHPHTHLYSSSGLKLDFPGRTFKIIRTLTYGEFKKDKRRWSASVISKNFPLKAEVLRKKHKIAESKEHFLFFCKDISEKLRVIYAEREH